MFGSSEVIEALHGNETPASQVCFASGSLPRLLNHHQPAEPFAAPATRACSKNSGHVEGPYAGDNRLEVLNSALWHISDHYGQLVEYIRTNGIVPQRAARLVGE